MPYVFLASLPSLALVFSLAQDILLDCSRVLEYAKIRTVVQSKENAMILDHHHSINARVNMSHVKPSYSHPYNLPASLLEMLCLLQVLCLLVMLCLLEVIEVLEVPCLLRLLEVVRATTAQQKNRTKDKQIRTNAIIP